MRVEHSQYTNHHRAQELHRNELLNYERHKAERLHKEHLERLRCNEVERLQLSKGRYVDIMV